MMDKIYNQIEDILGLAGGRPLLKREIFEELQASYDYKGSVRKVERALHFLREEGIAEQVTTRATRKGRTLTTVGWIHSLHIVDKDIGYETDYDKKIRSSHTKDIKEKVIQPWIEKMPFVHWDGVFVLEVHPDGKDIPREVNLRAYKPEKNKENMEALYPKDVDPDLFEDFRDCHIHKKIESNPIELWGEFNSLSWEYWHRFEKIITGKLPDFIESHFKDNLKNMEYPRLFMTILLGFWEKVGCPYHLIYPKENRFILFKIIDKDIHYYPDIRKGTSPSTRKNMIESKFGQSALSREITEIANELVKLLKDIDKIKNQLNRTLNKYSFVQNLPGDCPYI